MNTPDDLVQRWNEQEYVESYLRVMSDRSHDGEEWARTLGVTPEATVLDLGCGDARILVALSPFIQRGIGMDVSRHQIRQARMNTQSARVRNVELVHSDLRDFRVTLQQFDVVMSIAALHHLSDPEKAELLSRACDVLKPGGLFYLSDDTFNFPSEEFEQRAAEIRRGWEQRFGREAYERRKRELCFDDFEMTPYLSDLQRMIEAAGLRTEQTETQGLHGATIRARKGR